MVDEKEIIFTGKKWNTAQNTENFCPPSFLEFYILKSLSFLCIAFKINFGGFGRKISEWKLEILFLL